MAFKNYFRETSNMDPDQARGFMESRMPGSYILLDVRQHAEYVKSHIPGATLIPLPELANRSGELPRQKPIITYCAMGGRSQAAARLLDGQGFENVYNLAGGIMAWDGLEASGPQDWAFDLAPDSDEPADWLAMAWSLEVGLGRCYRLMAESISDKDAAALLLNLADVERHHQGNIEHMYKSLPPEQRGKPLPTIERPVFMEGGLNVEEFLARDSAHQNGSEHFLQMAIALEAQALDLYWRLSSKTSDRQVKVLLMEIAAEEQAHIAALGNMLDEIASGQ